MRQDPDDLKPDALFDVLDETTVPANAAFRAPLLSKTTG